MSATPAGRACARAGVDGAARAGTGQGMPKRSGEARRRRDAAARRRSGGCVSVLARECRDHLPGALENPLVQLALDDCPQDRFLAFGVGRVGHLAGPHPGDRATQVRVRVATPEHGDHLHRLNASAVAGGGVPLLRPRQLPVCIHSAIAIIASPMVDRATAAQEGHVCLIKNPPHNRIKQANGAVEYLYAFRPLTGAFVGPAAKIADVAEDVCRPGREILGHASLIPRPHLWHAAGT
jgi:hypothetical protein